MAKIRKQVEIKSFFQKDKLLIGCIILLLLTVMYFFGKSQSLFLGSTQIQEPIPTVAIPTPTKTPLLESPTPISTYIDPDPIVNCGPGVNSKQYVKDRQSNCKNYIDCGLNGNTVYTMMLKTECDKKQVEETSKNNSNNNSPSDKASDRVAVYVSSGGAGGMVMYCNPQNIDAIKGLDSAIIQARTKASELYSSCLTAKLNNCTLDWTYANSLSKQLLDLCNK